MKPFMRKAVKDMIDDLFYYIDDLPLDQDDIDDIFDYMNEKQKSYKEVNDAD